MKQINLQQNLRKKFIKKGVKMIAPDTVFFSKDTKIGKNVSIEKKTVSGAIIFTPFFKNFFLKLFCKFICFIY